MDTPHRVVQRAQRARQCCLGTSALATLLVLLAVIVPCAVLLPDRARSGLPSTVLLPLYRYPTPNAWEPLYHSIDATAHPKFTVIINPDNGPGARGGPPADYIAAVQKLKSARDVEVIGYVPTGYASRDITAVLEDIATYSRWAQVAHGLAVSGIFFDEAPSEYSSSAVEYMNRINNAVKDASGILEPKLIVHNPGMIPDPRFNNPTTDVTVVFEQSYQRYEELESALSSLPLDRSRYACLLHSVPASENMDGLLNGLSRHAEYLFATTLVTNYYKSFGPHWTLFVDSMPT